MRGAEAPRRSFRTPGLQQLVGVIGQKGRDVTSAVKITPDPVTVTRLLLGAKGK